MQPVADLEPTPQQRIDDAFSNLPNAAEPPLEMSPADYLRQGAPTPQDVINEDFNVLGVPPEIQPPGPDYSGPQYYDDYYYQLPQPYYGAARNGTARPKTEGDCTQSRRSVAR